MKQSIVVIVVITLFLAFWLFPREDETIEFHQGPMVLETFEVTLKGEVVFPGTYVFYDQISLDKAISFAGGLTNNADIEALNLNQVLNRNREIIIPSLENEIEYQLPIVNVNEASFKELLSIPYMSESKAAALIVYREQNGYFQSLDDLIHVKYIGVVTLEKIRPYITIG